MADKKPNIYRRIADIADEIGHFEKDGQNYQFNFKYAGIEQIVNKLRPICFKHGVAIIQEALPESTVHQFQGKQGINNITTCTVITHAVNLDDPTDKVSIQTPGQGYDSLDKGIFKALSGARKYGIFGLFNLHAGDDDPEYDGAATAKKPAQSGKPASRTKPAAKPGSKPPGLRSKYYPGVEWPPKKTDRDGQTWPINLPPLKGNWLHRISQAQEQLLIRTANDVGVNTEESRTKLFGLIYKMYETEPVTQIDDMKKAHASFLLDAMNHKGFVVPKRNPETKAEPQEAAAPDPDKMSDKQRKQMFASLGDLGIKDKEEQLGKINGILERHKIEAKESRGDLTKDQARMVIDALQAELLPEDNMGPIDPPSDPDVEPDIDLEENDEDADYIQ